MIAKGARPPGTRKALKRGTLTPGWEAVSSFSVDLTALRVMDAEVETRGSFPLSRVGDIARQLFGARICR